MLAKGSAKSLELNHMTFLAHILGVTHLQVHYLSRLFAPNTPVKLGQLEGVPLDPVTLDGGFWKVAKLAKTK